MNGDWPDEPVKLNDQNFDEFIEKYDVALIDCWADWCGPCKMLEPIIEELAEEMAGEVAFGKLDVDENGGKSGEYGVTSIPTLLMFKDGELVDKLIGAMPKDALKQNLEKYT